MQEFTYRMIEDGSYCIMAYSGDEKNIVIPDDRNITVLSDNLFSGHSEIESVRIPDTVTDMGEFLFDGCENLHILKLPSGLKYLWGYTFARCGLTEISLPDNLVSIPSFAFKDCKSLKKVVCGKGLKNIYAWAFAGCDSINELYFGPGVKISPDAFSYKELNK